MKMKIRLIRSEEDHAEALEVIENLWDAEPGSPERDTLDVLALLVDLYEREHFPIKPPTPVEAIKFRMEQAGLSRKDLLHIFGTTGRASEVLNGVRPLTIEMIRALHKELGIPYESLVGEKPRGRSLSPKSSVRSKGGAKRPSASQSARAS